MARFFGGLMIAAGVLIAGLSGLCSLAVAARGLAGLLHGQGNVQALLSAIFVVGLFGGVPFGIGFLLVVLGRRLYAGR